MGRTLNPLQLLGQLEGGAAQGVGLAVMEEIVVADGRMLNPSFTDYLIPTALDLPDLRVAAVIEEPEPGAPFGAKGVGEPPTISSGAAVAAAIRDATGLADHPGAGPAGRHRPGRQREHGADMSAATTQLRIDRTRLLGRLDALAEIGAIDGGGVCRLALTEDDGAGRDLVVSWMRDLGLRIDVDGIGNVVGTWPADRLDPPVMTGSHIDTVATGGRYDGNLGVLAGLEVLETVIGAGVTTERPIGGGVLHQRGGLAVRPRHARQPRLRRWPRRSRWRSTRSPSTAPCSATSCDRIGYVGPMPCPARPPHAFVELHIEQGPVLEAAGETIGVVTGVQGISWHQIELRGQSNHAGTTPMHLRHDAGYVAAAIAVAVRDLTVRHPWPGRHRRSRRAASRPGQRRGRPGHVDGRPAPLRRRRALRGRAVAADDDGADRGGRGRRRRRRGSWPASSP